MMIISSSNQEKKNNEILPEEKCSLFTFDFLWRVNSHYFIYSLYTYICESSYVRQENVARVIGGGGGEGWRGGVCVCGYMCLRSKIAFPHKSWRERWCKQELSDVC